MFTLFQLETLFSATYASECLKRLNEASECLEQFIYQTFITKTLGYAVWDFIMEWNTVFGRERNIDYVAMLHSGWFFNSWGSFTESFRMFFLCFQVWWTTLVEKRDVGFFWVLSMMIAHHISFHFPAKNLKCLLQAISVVSIVVFRISEKALIQSGRKSGRRQREH